MGASSSDFSGPNGLYAEHVGREFNIVVDDCVGCFLYVLENGECTGSFLFDAQDQAQACAMEKFGVPIAAWMVR